MAVRDRAGALRQRMAYEAARILAEQGGNDFERARRKAAERTGIRDRRSWPSNEAIQEAVLIQRRLFHGKDQARDLMRMRASAIKAMRAFEAFSPHLIGPGLTGSGRPEEGITLYLFAQQPEDVVFRLIERQIPWQERERTVRYSGGERRIHPAFGFVAGDIPFELIVLPRGALRNPPLDPVSERPERGGDLAEVERLLASGEDAESPRILP